MSHDTSSSTRTFLVTDLVLIKNFNNTGPKWLQGHIIQPVGPLSYLVKLTDGRIFRRHIDHLQKSSITPNTIPDMVPEDYSDVVFPDQVTQTDNATHRILSEIDTLQTDTGFEV